ncbi:hypothetical protein TWF281_010533 [Arthrobotrys megalospora]
MDSDQKQATNRKKGKAPERFSEFQVHGRKRRRTSPSNDTSSSGIFPLDVWLLIADFIPTQDTQTVSVLTRVSKTLYQNLSPRLYRDLVASAPSHGNLRGFIELVEGYVSIFQGRSLQEEHILPGRNTEFPEGLDEGLIPYCTQYVRRMLVGWSNPGAANTAVLASYLETVLQNLTNLETLVWLDNHIYLGDVIGERLARLRLKAFVFNFCSQRDPSSLSGIKNLVYLDIFRTHGRGTPGGIKELLLGSKDTLETLIYEEGLAVKDVPVDSGELLHHEGEIIKFPRLNTLCLRFNRLTAPEARGLLSGIDFTHLTYLEFSTCKHAEEEDKFSHRALFQALLDAYGPDSESGHLMLKTLRFRSQEPVYPGQAFFSLISSFDTLRTFIFEETRDNQGDPEKENLDDLLSALSFHKNLEWLSIHIPSYAERGWQFSKDQLIRVRDSFPELKHLACSCQRSEEVRIGPNLPSYVVPMPGLSLITRQDEIYSILPTMPRLVSFAMPSGRPTMGWINAASQVQFGIIAGCILPAFLRQLQNGSTESKPRSWDDKYKLSLLVIGGVAYEVRSRFPEGLKQREEEQAREVRTDDGVVSFRRVTPQQLYDGEFPDINLMKAVEWRIRNYGASKGDWCQGIKL